MNCHQINHPKAQLLFSLLLAQISSLVPATPWREARVRDWGFPSSLCPAHLSDWTSFPFCTQLQPDTLSITPKFYISASIVLFLGPFSRCSFSYFSPNSRSSFKVQLRFSHEGLQNSFLGCKTSFQPLNFHKSIWVFLYNNPCYYL